MQLELLARVAQVTLRAILRVVDDRQSGALNAAQVEKVAAVQTHVESALNAVDDYMERHGEDAVDLSGLRGRLVRIVRDLDKRVPELDSQPS